MANYADRLAINADGKYYVDSTCIDCDLCRQIAPELFMRDDEGNGSYVARQPENHAEEEMAREAADTCPSNSIGFDGEVELEETHQPPIL
jgi:ferredoxin